MDGQGGSAEEAAKRMILGGRGGRSLCDRRQRWLLHALLSGSQRPPSALSRPKQAQPFFGGSTRRALRIPPYCSHTTGAWCCCNLYHLAHAFNTCHDVCHSFWMRRSTLKVPVRLRSTHMQSCSRVASSIAHAPAATATFECSISWRNLTQPAANVVHGDFLVQHTHSEAHVRSYAVNIICSPQLEYT